MDEAVLNGLVSNLTAICGQGGFVRDVLTALHGIPFLFLLITAAHAVLRNLLSPFLGRAGASLTALSAVALALGVFSVKAVHQPAVAWSLVAWAANAAGAASVELFAAIKKPAGR